MIYHCEFWAYNSEGSHTDTKKCIQFLCIYLHKPTFSMFTAMTEKSSAHSSKHTWIHTGIKRKSFTQLIKRSTSNKTFQV